MDLLVLHALMNRQRFNSLSHVVPTSMLTPETSALMAWFSLYYQAFPEAKQIIPEDLATLVRLRSAPGTSAEALAVTLHMVNRLNEPVSEQGINGILGQLQELALAGTLGALLARYNNGEEVNLAFESRALADQAVRSIGQSTPDTYCDIPIDVLLKEVSNDAGIKFRRLAVLRENIGGLQGGADVIVAARPDKGKTSFVADVITDWSPQVVQFFGADRPILWLVNEGSSKRVVPRLYQAALGKDLNQIIEMSNAGTLVPEYEKALGAPHTFIRVKDAHGMSLPQIEQVIESMRPSVVVFDMIANVRLGKSNGNGNKADEVEQLHQGVRELAVLKDFIALKTMQVSAEGGNMLYPPYSALKDSKTAAQGATDIIIMVGSLDNPDAQMLRGISTPKNKFALPGKQSYAQAEAYFNGAICRFDDGSSYVASPQ